MKAAMDGMRQALTLRSLYNSLPDDWKEAGIKAAYKERIAKVQYRCQGRDGAMMICWHVG